MPLLSSTSPRGPKTTIKKISRYVLKRSPAYGFMRSATRSLPQRRERAFDAGTC